MYLQNLPGDGAPCSVSIFSEGPSFFNLRLFSFFFVSCRSTCFNLTAEGNMSSEESTHRERNLDLRKIAFSLLFLLHISLSLSLFLSQNSS